MITLFFITLIGTAFFFASVPVVLFALMMETCARRAARGSIANNDYGIGFVFQRMGRPPAWTRAKRPLEALP